jgi:hypothetical protein
MIPAFLERTPSESSVITKVGDAVEQRTTSASLRRSYDFVEGDRLTTELGGKFLSGVLGTVRYQDSRYSGVEKVSCRQFGHFACADQEHCVILQRVEDLLPQLTAI